MSSPAWQEVDDNFKKLMETDTLLFNSINKNQQNINQLVNFQGKQLEYTSQIEDKIRTMSYVQHIQTAVISFLAFSQFFLT